MEVTYSNIDSFKKGLQPERRQTLREWSESNRKLQSKSSAESGPYRMKRTPYLIKIADRLSNHSKVQEIIGKKGIQLGWTELGFNWMAYKADTAPGSFMYLMPTIETMERNVKARIDPMIESIPSLQAKFGKKRSKDGGNTLKQKDYTGGVWYLSGANSAASLASVPVRDIMFDEMDRYPMDVDGEGDPVSLAEKRQATFGTRKTKFKISTPTIKGRSPIEYAYLNTDQQHYFVPCPHCKKLQYLKFEQLRWTPGKYTVEDVYYECEHCKGKIYERHKTWMFAEENGAEWIATRPDLARPDIEGFFLPSFYSPDGWLAWWEICKEWDESEGNIPRRKTIINTIFAETYEEDSEAPEWQALYERTQALGVEPNKPFSSVAFITAGVDVQKDRLEIEIVGWMQGQVSQQIDYRVLMGDTNDAEVWEVLDELLNETFIREDGAVLPIRQMAIDTGFRNEKVYEFVKKHGIMRVIPIRGIDNLQMPFSPPKAIQITKKGEKLGKIKVWNIGVSLLKSQFYGWLKQKINPETGAIPKGYCHFTKRDTHYFRGLTSEAVQPVRNKQGRLKYQWVKKFERNEPLDCRVYATAGAYIVGFDRWTDKRWEQETRGAKPEKQSEKIVVPKKTKKTSGFWDRNRTK